ncbi:MAG: flagellar hook capping FlgD N-terminal domain-containing protein [Rickettsiales bacterium]|nr:flagellar hook capping FlgD N-terminal domain-containing protein [Rickettsiales bacterium]
MVSAIGSSFITNKSSSFQEGSDAFLKTSEDYLQLFMAQIKYQDPTEPFGVDKMASQLANLSSVQQSIETNTSLKDLLKVSSSSQASSVANFINRQVEYIGNEFYYFPEAGSQNVSYKAEKDFSSAIAEIKDEGGKTIWKGSVESTQGEHKFSWDGKDDLGNAKLEGKYSVLIYGMDAEGKQSPFQTITNGIVSGVDYTQNGQPTLVFGNQKSPIKVSIANVANVFGGGEINIINNN